MAKIYAHCDFDGLISAILLNQIFPFYEVSFVTPTGVYSQAISKDDIVADLPYPHVCRLWFDHHKTNCEELQDRNIDVNTIPGSWKDEKSAAQVIYDYYKEKISDKYIPMVEAANIIDTMGYNSVEEWQQESPAKIINDTLSLKNQRYDELHEYLSHLFEILQKIPLEKVAKTQDVDYRYKISQKEQKQDLEFIPKISRFIDPDKRILVLDYTNLSYPPRVEKNLAVKLFPECELIIAISCELIRGRKTNNVKLSVGKNFVKQNEFDKDLGSYFSEINIGGGHKNAAGGKLFADSKQQREQEIEMFLKDLESFWKE